MSARKLTERALMPSRKSLFDARGAVAAPRAAALWAGKDWCSPSIKIPHIADLLRDQAEGTKSFLLFGGYYDVFGP